MWQVTVNLDKLMQLAGASLPVHNVFSLIFPWLVLAFMVIKALVFSLPTLCHIINTERSGIDVLLPSIFR